MINKIKNFISKHKTLFCVSAMSAFSTICLAMSCFAVGETSPDVKAVMTTSAQTIATDLLSMITGILPIAITVFAAGIAVTYGYKFIRKVIGK